MTSEIQSNSIDSLVESYIANRDQFLTNGGAHYLADRQSLRSDYCNANVSKAALDRWTGNLPSNSVKEEFKRRFQEWDHKIQHGQIKKCDTATLTESDFLGKVDSFYKKYQTLIQGKNFEDFTEAKSALRNALLPELALMSVDEVANNHSIKDQEIIYRMKNEWSWKAKCESKELGFFGALWHSIRG